MERICVAAFSFFMYFCIACINLRIMNSMFEILMDLPLFQGVSRDKLSELIEKTPFHFLKFADGDEVVAGEGGYAVPLPQGEGVAGAVEPQCAWP